MRVGFHVSIRGSISLAIERAEMIGMKTFQMFTRNPRSWKFKPFDPEEVDLFKKKISEVDIEPVFVHMPYLSNLSSPRSEVYALSVKSLSTELERCDELKIPFLVTHLGSHLGSGKTMGFKRIMEGIDNAFSNAKSDTMLLLENTSGTKNSIGSSFEDIRRVINGITFNERIGICFDTCHAFAAGYDLREVNSVENTIKVLDSVLGLWRLKLVHLNDSIGDLGSCRDRHEHVGLGKIGEEGFKAILTSAFRRFPLIMETPLDERRSDIENLLKVRELAYM